MKQKKTFETTIRIAALLTLLLIAAKCTAQDFVIHLKKATPYRTERGIKQSIYEYADKLTTIKYSNKIGYQG